MKNVLKEGLVGIGISAAALVFTATQAFAVPTVMDAASKITFDGPEDGVDVHYDLTFDLSSDANWASFDSILSTNIVTSVFLHIDLTPKDPGFTSDRMRVMWGAGPVVAKTDPRLETIAGSGVNDYSNSTEDRVLKYSDLGVDLGLPYRDLEGHPGGVYAIDTPGYIDIELLNWYDAADLTTLLRDNDGVMHIVSGDDSIVHGAYLTVTLPEPIQGGAVPTPEPASLILFGSGLVGLVGWRMRRNQVQA